MSPEQKKAQKENAKARLDAGLKAVETTESLDKLKEVESDFLKKEKQNLFHLNIKQEPLKLLAKLS
ncbi:hypothetical protein HMPREF1236_1948 [Streptococcus pyogenes GA40056]|nr:hypothetical protein HMPREF1236_1948 [Streptococcus pyogenes GA40056]